MPLLFLGDWGLQRINRMVYGDLQMPEAVLEFGRLVGRHFRPTTEPVPVLTEAQLAQLHMPVQYFGGAHDALLRSDASAARLAQFVPHAGMIWSPNHGDTAFTVPLFDEFMKRIMPGDDWLTA